MINTAQDNASTRSPNIGDISEVPAQLLKDTGRQSQPQLQPVYTVR